MPSVEPAIRGRWEGTSSGNGDGKRSTNLQFFLLAKHAGGRSDPRGRPDAIPNDVQASRHRNTAAKRGRPSCWGAPLAWLAPSLPHVSTPCCWESWGNKTPSLDDQTDGLLWRSGFSSPSTIPGGNFLFPGCHPTCPLFLCTLVDEDEDKQERRDKARHQGGRDDPRRNGR